MKTIKKITLVFLFSMVLSCDDDNDPTNNVCEENYAADAIFSTFNTTNGYVGIAETMDLETHEYTIKINADGEICTIGYQNPSTYTGTYTMEIINNSTSQTYSDIHSFSQSTLDYQAIIPVVVNIGDVVTVRRTVSPGYSNPNEIIGRNIKKSDNSSLPYPISSGNIEFLESKHYTFTSSITQDSLIPVIGLGFLTY